MLTVRLEVTFMKLVLRLLAVIIHYQMAQIIEGYKIDPATVGDHVETLKEAILFEQELRE
jgi:hypothetical protein